MGKGHKREKRDGMLFAPLPIIVIQSPQFAALSAHAVKLLIDLLAQYNGHNNGDFCAAWTVMEKSGWRSRDTLGKALGELQQARFICQTRQGGRNRASLYGVTFYQLDDSPKLDVMKGDFPRSAWSTASPMTKPRRNANGRKKRKEQPAKRVSCPIH